MDYQQLATPRSADSHPLSGSLQVNFTALHKETQRTLCTLLNQTLSWTERIDVVKAFILPKYLFLFRMLPLSILHRDLQRWQRTLNDFVWNNKRHRISFKVLRQTTKQGGLGIPDLKYYYMAANLTTIARLTTHSTAIDWMTIELDALREMSGYDLIWQTPKQRKALQITNTYLNTTQHIWDLWKPKLVRKYSRLMTLTHHGWFSPDLETILCTWKSKGVLTLKDITKKGRLLLKQDIESLVHTKLMWLHYFQLRTVLTQKHFEADLTKEMTDFECLLALDDSSTKRKLSVIYKSLLATDKDPFLSPMKKWGVDCGKHFTTQDWTKIKESYVVLANALPLKLQTIKLLYRWYLTPRQIACIHNTASNLCWKGCGSDANYLHCWWACPLLQDFWNKVCEAIYKITSYRLHHNPETILLHNWEAELPRALERTLATLLIHAKLEIASKWKDTKRPSI